MNHLPLSIALTFLAVLTPSSRAAEVPSSDFRGIPLQPGLVIVSALRWQNGDRENVVKIERQSANGVTYGWETQVRGADGKPDRTEFHRFVRAVDLEKATRLHSVYWQSDKTDYPGYTGWSLSTGIYDALMSRGEAALMIVIGAREADGAQEVISGLLRQTTRLKGVLRLTSKQPQMFPVLYNGTRTTIPAIRVSGRFASDAIAEDVELSLLADRTHPLLLRSVMGQDVWQIVRIETPQHTPARMLEQQLIAQCRAELSGIYFAFATAALDAQSDRTLAAVAQVLGEHADWSISIEGHTDNIGSNASNAKLSTARAEAVRSSLTRRYSIASTRLKAAGFGATRPRESNDSLEGRARNRRVEIVRACSQSPD